MIYKHKLDFLILDDEDTKSLCFLDKSDYFKRPEKPTLEVKFPNIDRIYSIVIDSCGFSRLTTKSLRYLKTEQDFPDGIYEIRYSVAPNDQVYLHKKFIKTSKLKKDLKNILENLEVNDELISKLYKIDLYLTASNLVIDTKEDLAVNFYKEAKKQIKDITDGSL